MAAQYKPKPTEPTKTTQVVTAEVNLFDKIINHFPASINPSLYILLIMQNANENNHIALSKEEKISQLEQKIEELRKQLRGYEEELVQLKDETPIMDESEIESGPDDHQNSNNNNNNNNDDCDDDGKDEE